MRKITLVALTFALLLFSHVSISGTTLIYMQQEVNPSAKWGFQKPWNIPIYMPNGPYLITRGMLAQTVFQEGEARYAKCTGFVADQERFIHGSALNFLQSYGRRTGISLSGKERREDEGPYMSALYADYFNIGEDIRPWRDANALVLEANVATPLSEIRGRDVGYVQYSILLQDSTTEKYVWWVWQVYDNRNNQPDEFVGVDVTPDGGDFSYVATSFAYNGLEFSTTREGSETFRHAPWNTPTWFGSRITRRNFRSGIERIAAQFSRYSDLSRNPKDYVLRAFYFYPELYMPDQFSVSRICTTSHGAILRTE